MNLCLVPQARSLPETVRLLFERVMLKALLTKCGLPARATGTATAAVVSASTATSNIDALEPLIGMAFDARKTHSEGPALEI